MTAEPDTAADIEPAFIARRDPDTLFEEWMAEAEASEPNDPNAVSLATIGEDGAPNLRTVLLKGHDERGFVFYTNFEGRKGRELSANPVAAMNFHWKTRARQVRLRGPIERVTDDEADTYYASRSLGSRIGAWASRQSQPVADRAALMDAVREAETRFGDAPPRPGHWGGFRLVPHEIEFWQDGAHRLHDRVRLTRDGLGGEWRAQRLQP